jgi:hypothetical protein
VLVFREALINSDLSVPVVSRIDLILERVFSIRVWCFRVSRKLPDAGAFRKG